MEYHDLKNESFEKLLNQVEGIQTLGTKGQIQSVAALAAKLAVELGSGLTELSGVAFTAKKQLVERMDLLTAELATLRGSLKEASELSAAQSTALAIELAALRASLKQASDDSGLQSKALENWTKVLVRVTAAYTLFTGGSLLVPILNSTESSRWRVYGQGERSESSRPSPLPNAGVVGRGRYAVA